jgi:DNA repair protein RadA/Sms
MAKQSTLYVCSECGNEASSWSGKCFSCGGWNTLQQISHSLIESSQSTAVVLKPEDIHSSLQHDEVRLISSISDFDMVLGGGFVAGSVVLLAGQPGIGKSTLLLQVANGIAQQHKVLYVSGEESAHQVGLRASRLGVESSNLQLVTSISTDDIAATIADKAHKFDLVIVDSIQTISCRDVGSAAGSVSQITNSTRVLTVAAKRANTALLLVGHVTKEGSIAGPKVLEHVVDVVLSLEGDRYGGLRVLRAIKNRFGSTVDTGIFEMGQSGLQAVDNPSAALLDQRQVSDGSVVLATMEGSRPLLVEVQALVNRTSYGYPKRAASGIDLNRINLLIAMLEKRTKLQLSDKDIYLNIVGGMKLSEPAADLAIVMAIASAAKGMQLKQDAVVFGEVGLSGEIRRVPYVEKRLAEAKKMSFRCAIGPQDGSTAKTYYGVRTIRDALNQFLTK